MEWDDTRITKNYVFSFSFRWALGKCVYVVVVGGEHTYISTTFLLAQLSHMGCLQGCQGTQLHPRGVARISSSQAWDTNERYECYTEIQYASIAVMHPDVWTDLELWEG